MNNRVKFYSWLIGQLGRRRMTFAEIADAWMDATANVYKEELTLRSFHRYRNAIWSQLGFMVECGSKADGYRYYVKKDPVECDEITEWLLSSLRLASLHDMLQYHNKVMLEAPPRNSEYLDDILCAIDKQYQLKFHYATPYGVEKDIMLSPAFVRLFKQRWYVIGVNENEQVRCLPFDRIAFMEVVCKRHPLSAKMKRLLTPDSFYDGCFGIMRMEDEQIENIRIRAFYPEYNLIEEVPLHESQQKVKESADGLYREYTLAVRPSRDFLQELLWHGRNIVVLKPESLKRQMIDILKDMMQSYETGECRNGEEDL